MAKENKKICNIRKELKEQLANIGKANSATYELVEDYIRFYNLQDDLFTDIKKRGSVVSVVNGNGFEVVKQNESVQNVLKVNTQMLKIISELGIKEPIVIAKDSDDDYL